MLEGCLRAKKDFLARNPVGKWPVIPALCRNPPLLCGNPGDSCIRRNDMLIFLDFPTGFLGGSLVDEHQSDQDGQINDRSMQKLFGIVIGFLNGNTNARNQESDAQQQGAAKVDDAG